MKKQTKSILQELNSIPLQRDFKHVVESRAENIIASAINLIEEIHKNYDSKTAGDLERRLINSIKAGDSKRFVRGIRRVD